jgi:hypothetical protein
MTKSRLSLIMRNAKCTDIIENISTVFSNSREGTGQIDVADGVALLEESTVGSKDRTPVRVVDQKAFKRLQNTVQLSIKH